MYKGTLLNDLMATVERAEQRVQQIRMIDEIELRRMFELEVPQTHCEPAYAGAA
jgi:hypothetical protein